MLVWCEHGDFYSYAHGGREARQHSSWKDCTVENLSWNGTDEENIEQYQREVVVNSQSIDENRAL